MRSVCGRSCGVRPRRGHGDRHLKHTARAQERGAGIKATESQLRQPRTMASASDSADMWSKVGEQTNTALAEAIEQARKAAEAARAEAFRAQEAAKAEAARASEAALRKVHEASTSALRQVERAADIAREQVAKVGDGTLDATMRAQQGGAGPSGSDTAAARGAAPAAASGAGTSAAGGASPSVSASGGVVLPSVSVRAAPTRAEMDDDHSHGNPGKEQFVELMKCLTLRPAALLPAAMAAHFAGFRGDSGNTVVRPLATGEYTWRIEGLSLERLRSYPPGQHVDSPPFCVDETYFFMRLFPAGDGREESKGYVSVYLHIRTPDKKITVDYEISVLNQSNALIFAREQAVKDMGLGLDGQPLPWTVISAGQPKYIQHTRLAAMRGEVLRNNTMIVTAKLTTSHQDPIADFRSYIQLPAKSMAIEMAALLASAEDSDVKFLVGDTSYKAHRIIVSARSPVLKAMLTGPGKGTVRVDEMDPMVFRNFLRYLYTEEFQDEVTPEMAQHLLVAGERYKVERLRLLCEQMLCARLDVPGAAHILMLADQHNATDLKRAASAFVAQNANAVMATPGWELLCASRPKLLSEVMRVMVPNEKGGGAAGKGAAGASSSSGAADSGTSGAAAKR